MGVSLWTPLDAGIPASIWLPGGPDTSVGFIDNFTGSVGTFDAHIPDVAPDGFLWKQVEGAAYPELDGNGNVIPGDTQDYQAWGNATTDGWAAFTIEDVVRMELNVDTTDEVRPTIGYIKFSPDEGGTTPYEISFDKNAKANSQITVYWPQNVGGLTSNSLSAGPSSIGTGTVEIVAILDRANGTLDVSWGGTAVTPGDSLDNNVGTVDTTVNTITQVILDIKGGKMSRVAMINGADPAEV